MDWGLAGSESRICKVAIRGPVIAGLKVIWMVQVAPSAKLWPQVFVCAKSMPEVTMSVIANGEVPVLARVAVFGGVAVSTGCLPKSRDSGVILTNAELPARRSSRATISCALAPTKKRRT